MQATTSDPCIYYSCTDHFGPAGKDSDNEQELEDESFNINVVGNSNGNARSSFEGWFLDYPNSALVFFVNYSNMVQFGIAF